MQEPPRLLEDEVQDLHTIIREGVEITIWHFVEFVRAADEMKVAQRFSAGNRAQCAA